MTPSLSWSKTHFYSILPINASHLDHGLHMKVFLAMLFVADLHLCWLDAFVIHSNALLSTKNIWPIKFLNLTIFQELYSHVAESLGDTYPEIVRNQHKIKMILDFEEENYQKMIKNSKMRDLKKRFPTEAESISPIESSKFFDSLKLLGKSVSQNRRIAH